MLEHIETPALVVDLDKMENNLRKMKQIARKKRVKLRPHVKTHKSPYIALKQIALGADGITVATLGEAEVMRRHGITDILIAYPIVGRNKLARLKRLAEGADMTVSLDSIEVARGIDAVGESLQRKMPVYVEVNTGLNRVGRQPNHETVQLIKELRQLPYLDIVGLMTHGGYAYKAKTVEALQEAARSEGEQLVQTKHLVKAELGLDIPEISVGSTPTALADIVAYGVTEMRPGTYVFHDATLYSLGVVTEEECALTICTTVVSHPAPHRFIVDAGSKTLTSDKGVFTKGYGLIKHSKEVWISWLSEEHGVVELEGPSAYKIGDQLEIIPNHVCPAVNLADALIGVRDGRFERIIQVEARGKNQ